MSPAEGSARPFDAAVDGAGWSGSTPRADSSGATLTSTSCHSSAGVESATIPPPTPRAADPSGATSRLLMVTASSVPPGATSPTAPVCAPRAVASTPSVTSVARCLGVPVTEPGGNVARRTAPDPVPGSSVPATRDTRCSTPVCVRTASSSSTRTEPGSHTRDRSLRTRSTIMMFSLVSLAEARRAVSSPAGRVPLMGEDVTRRPASDTYTSGEAPTSAPQGPVTSAARSGRSPATSVAQARTAAGPPSGSCSPSLVQTLAWAMSPARTAVTTRSTAAMWAAASGSCRRRAVAPRCRGAAASPRSDQAERAARASPSARRSAEPSPGSRDSAHQRVPSKRSRWSWKAACSVGSRGPSAGGAGARTRPSRRPSRCPSSTTQPPPTASTPEPGPRCTGTPSSTSVSSSSSSGASAPATARVSSSTCTGSAVSIRGPPAHPPDRADRRRAPARSARARTTSIGSSGRSTGTLRSRRTWSRGTRRG